MAFYKIEIKRTAEKEIARLPRQEIPRLTNKILSLSTNPYPPGLEKLRANKYRIRQGNYRIIYQVQQKEKRVLIIKVGDRKEVYRHL